MKRKWILKTRGDGWDYEDEAERFFTRWGARAAARRLNSRQGAVNGLPGIVPLVFVAERDVSS